MKLCRCPYYFSCFHQIQTDLQILLLYHTEVSVPYVTITEPHDLLES